jgi:hypothetical protein
MMYFVKKMNTRALTRPTSVPKPLLGLLLNLFYLIGTLAGWEKQFRQYTEEYQEFATSLLWQFVSICGCLLSFKTLEEAAAQPGQ